MRSCTVLLVVIPTYARERTPPAAMRGGRLSCKASPAVLRGWSGHAPAERASARAMRSPGGTPKTWT
eukprot:scaffold2507_cov81-Phaeocystis_antarctica.AAC.4